ncbi:MAG: family 10 glycosylhydrolase [Prevotellaceae bacterium]|jgi:uncharacterized lipoprotein YddW (UPF0748 family)|nr:family 10 glycosylhydrolase [Prevotellaceae bacterium]
MKRNATMAIAITRFFYCTLVVFFIFLTTACNKENHPTPAWEWPDPPPPPDTDTDDGSKPRFIWIDASANFPDFANSRDNIRRDLTLAANAGFTHIVVDVRPPSGDALFATARLEQARWLGAWVGGVYTKITRTAGWDYLQAFIDIGHELNLKVYAGFNTFVGGNYTALGGNGLLYRDPAKKAWATSLLTAAGVVNMMDNPTTTDAKFLNPANDEVQEFIVRLLEDLAAYPDLDGIILDRARYHELDADFSAESRAKFEAYLGSRVERFPDDVMRYDVKTGQLPAVLPVHFKAWLEFRAKVIYDFMDKARTRVKAKNPNLTFGAYVGGWYSDYYGMGVNWASPAYNPAANYPAWAGANYKNYGFAALMDVVLIGAYAAPTSVYGSSEWTVQGFCARAKTLVAGDALVVGGPDVGNYGWDGDTPAILRSVTQSVDAAINACDGYFLFDMIHLKLKPQKWQAVKTGIDNYLVNG